MNLLLDSHTLIWAVDEPGNLGNEAKASIQNPSNDIFLSSGSIWEMAIKIGLGKLSLTLRFKNWINQAMNDLEASLLTVTVEHANRIIDLPEHHGDPFDRLLIAQSQVENFPIVSKDSHMKKYDAEMIW